MRGASPTRPLTHGVHGAWRLDSGPGASHRGRPGPRSFGPPARRAPRARQRPRRRAGRVGLAGPPCPPPGVGLDRGRRAAAALPVAAGWPGRPGSAARGGGAGPVALFDLPRRPCPLHHLAADGLGQVNAQAALARPRQPLAAARAGARLPGCQAARRRGAVAHSAEKAARSRPAPSCGRAPGSGASGPRPGTSRPTPAPPTRSGASPTPPPTSGPSSSKPPSSTPWRAGRGVQAPDAGAVRPRGGQADPAGPPDRRSHQGPLPRPGRRRAASPEPAPP
jgi:hypothetical protein